MPFFSLCTYLYPTTDSIFTIFSIFSSLQMIWSQVIPKSLKKFFSYTTKSYYFLCCVKELQNNCRGSCAYSRHSRPLISIPVISQRTGERISIQPRPTPQPLSASVVWTAAAPDTMAESTTHHIYPSIHHGQASALPQRSSAYTVTRVACLQLPQPHSGPLKHSLQQLSGLVRAKSEANAQHVTTQESWVSPWSVCLSHTQPLHLEVSLFQCRLFSGLFLIQMSGLINAPICKYPDNSYY